MKDPVNPGSESPADLHVGWQWGPSTWTGPLHTICVRALMGNALWASVLFFFFWGGGSQRWEVHTNTLVGHANILYVHLETANAALRTWNRKNSKFNSTVSFFLWLRFCLFCLFPKKNKKQPFPWLWHRTSSDRLKSRRSQSVRNDPSAKI